MTSSGINLTQPAPSQALPTDFLGWGDPRLLSNSAAAPTANQLYGYRMIVRKSGTVKDFHVFIANSSGNVEGSIYDTSATTRNRLWSSGSMASPGTGWQKLGDPNIVVSAGDHIDLCLSADNATITFNRFPSLGSGVIPTLPSGFWTSPLSGSPKLVWSVAASFPAPSTLLESNLAQQTVNFAVIARIQ